ncbi:MAG: hypothetical protein SAJ37_04300 [Oscillatoria sp. PMC 1068.18]|nr:hypothetical protein [Oscillatoria sp. PMC 1076.18]MEC4987949.1 hypothetical protein [Oscillatoria sp. PMC 1068.18]
MNWKQLCSGILLGSLASFIGLPSQAHDTTAQLNQAICIEAWEGAIAILNQAIPDYPNSQNTLKQYREILQQLSTTGLSEVQKSQYCSRTLTQTNTIDIEESPALYARIEGYFEQIDLSRGYNAIASSIGRPGKISSLYSSYAWNDQGSLSAHFSDDQLEDLSISEGLECQRNAESDEDMNCETIPPPEKFERIAERFNPGMNAQVVLQSIVQELGEPSSQWETVAFEWQFREERDTCNLLAHFVDNELLKLGLSCFRENP